MYNIYNAACRRRLQDVSNTGINYAKKAQLKKYLILCCTYLCVLVECCNCPYNFLFVKIILVGT